MTPKIKWLLEHGNRLSIDIIKDRGCHVSYESLGQLFMANMDTLDDCLTFIIVSSSSEETLLEIERDTLTYAV